MMCLGLKALHQAPPHAHAASGAACPRLLYMF